MFTELRLVIQAFSNMLHWAVRHPLTALVQIVLSPFMLWPTIKRLALTLIGLLIIGLFIEVWFPKNQTWMFILANSILIIVVAVIVFRLSTASLLLNFGQYEGRTHGTARFATRSETRHLTDANYNSDIIVGRDCASGKLLHYPGTAHLLTMAPTRSGKGIGTIIPNLLVLNRSIFCIDPKGENVAVTLLARSKFGPIAILDPFGITGHQSARYNPLASLDPAELDIAEDASVIAEALVHDAPDSNGDAHWNEEAKALLAGLILHLVSIEEPEDRNLGRLREYLTLAPMNFSALLDEMQVSRACGGLVARAANRHLGKSEREAAGVLSSAQRHTHFLDSPRMVEALSDSDFTFSDLKAGICTIFLVIPPDRMYTYSRWLRLMVTLCLDEMAKAQSKVEKPVLFLLDEFAALGHLAPVERAFGLMAGYGVQLWPILQDIHQLKATYGRNAGSFLSNAGMLQMFGVNDNDSAKLASDLLGQSTVVFSTFSQNLDADKSGLTNSEQHIGRPLLTADEVRNLPPNNQLLFLNGLRPILANKIRYYEDPEFNRK